MVSRAAASRLRRVRWRNSQGRWLRRVRDRQRGLHRPLACTRPATSSRRTPTRSPPGRCGCSAQGRSDRRRRSSRRATPSTRTTWSRRPGPLEHRVFAGRLDKQSARPRREGRRRRGARAGGRLPRLERDRRLRRRHRPAALERMNRFTAASLDGLDEPVRRYSGTRSPTERSCTAGRGSRWPAGSRSASGCRSARMRPATAARSDGTPASVGDASGRSRSSIAMRTAPPSTEGRLFGRRRIFGSDDADPSGRPPDARPSSPSGRHEPPTGPGRGLAGGSK